jgi:prephenate dehydrogenase
MDTLVVGAGEMGRWFATVLVADAPESVDVTFCDRREGAASEAARRVGGTATTAPEGQFDLVCIAVPIPAATAAIEAYSDQASEAIVDVTGTMRDPVEAMRDHAVHCERASFHPLFAPANEPGNVPVVVDESGSSVQGVRAALEARGNDVFETTPRVHDEAMETVQARTHAAVLAFALSASDVPERFQTPISEELVTLTEQVTGGEGRVYADIQAAFGGAADVADAATDLADADPDTFEQLYDRASPDNWAELPTDPDEDESA